eukprot:TRINITY_DN2150_c0_g1_i1.p1 TRINITY_DN2150_c0_g1~~TRINITY_DN2150_c0_g1_i1.p1  ORF type:complete len:147 (-),score=47.93 TRINITY_DN2150_c0_g1_i1:32-472(-)
MDFVLRAHQGLLGISMLMFVWFYIPAVRYAPLSPSEIFESTATFYFQIPVTHAHSVRNGAMSFLLLSIVNGAAIIERRQRAAAKQGEQAKQQGLMTATASLCNIAFSLHCVSEAFVFGTMSKVAVTFVLLYIAGYIMKLNTAPLPI